MGKKLVIKGADFSQNGFVYELVKKEITSLYKVDGTLATTGESISSADSTYFYENNNGSLVQGSALRGAVSTTPTSSGDYIDVEDYTDATIITTCGIEEYGTVKGAALMFFLNSSKAIIGGISTGPSTKGCTNVGASNSERTYTVKIPDGAKYVVCTAQNNATKKVPNFKLTLWKKVIS